LACGISDPALYLRSRSQFAGVQSRRDQSHWRYHQAEIHYFSRYERYTTSLGELAALDEIATGEKYGYVLSLSITLHGYEVHAEPMLFGRTGRRAFYSDETMTIRQNWGPEPAGLQSAELK
jgi:hypothetical protein